MPSTLVVIIASLLVAVAAVSSGFYLAKKQPHNGQGAKKSEEAVKSSRDRKAPSSFDVCAGLDRLSSFISLEAASAEQSCTTPACFAQAFSAPTLNRSSEVHRWIENATSTLLSFGTRVAGAKNKGRRRALKFMRDAISCSAFSSLPGWSTREDRFSQNTVIGQREFTNLLLTTNAACSSSPHIVVAAHWDSKFFDETKFKFLGACDSAVPVVMMQQMIRHVAAITSKMLAASKRQESSGSGGGEAVAASDCLLPELPRITFMFLDGEEAFVDWKGDDNTYGSRHLAAIYEQEGRIRDIDLFLLLDLLGPTNPVIRNSFPAQSGISFKRVEEIEARQRAANQRRTRSPTKFFDGAANTGGVDDDHIPWLRRGVPVLHVISVPFPPHWHEKGDDGSNIDYENTTVDLYNIIAEFTLTFKKR